MNQPENNIVYDETIEDFLASKPCMESKIDLLDLVQRFMLRRLRFSEELLSAELNLSSSEVTSTKDKIYYLLDVDDEDEAIKFAELYDVTQLSLESDPREKKIFENEILATISSWLEKSLTNPKPWR